MYPDFYTDSLRAGQAVVVTDSISPDAAQDLIDTSIATALQPYAQSGYFWFDDFNVANPAALDVDAASPTTRVGQRSTWQQIGNADGGGGGALLFRDAATGNNTLYNFFGSVGTGAITYYCGQAPKGADYSVSASIVFKTNNSSVAGVIARQDYTQAYGYVARYNCGNQRWELCVISNNVLTVLSFFAQAFAAGTKTVTLRVGTNSQTLEVDGVVVCEGTDDSVAGPGSPGVYFKGASTSSTGLHIDAVWGIDNSTAQPWNREYGLVYVGDSNGTNSVGVFGPLTVSQRIANALGCVDLNYSEGGRQLTGWLASGLAASTTAGAARLRGMVEKLAAVVALGTNDFAEGSRTAAQMLADVVATVVALRAAGYDYIVYCIPPKATGLSGGEETERLAFEAACTEAATGADKIVNLATLFPQVANLTFTQADGLHRTAAGFQSMADAIVLAITATQPDKLLQETTAASYTIGSKVPRVLYGGVVTAASAATLTVPAWTRGASFLVVTEGAVAVSIDPNAADKIYLDGVALDDGDKITNLSTPGDTAYLFAREDGTGWNALTNGWTDGGP